MARTSRTAHVRATPTGEVVIGVRGGGRATVSLRSAWRIPSRWLGGARPRIVRFGQRDVDLRPGTTTDVTFRLSKDHLALLRRMQAVRATIRVQTDDRVRTRWVWLHPPVR